MVRECVPLFTYHAFLKVRCGWILVVMYLRPLLDAKTIFQILQFYVKKLKSYHHFYISVLPSAR